MKLESGYILGFVEGEGTFNLVKYPDKRVRPQFLVFNTNKEILESIKETLEIQAPIFEVSRIEDLIKVIDFFEKNKPIIKNKDYQIFKSSFEKWINKR